MQPRLTRTVVLVGMMGAGKTLVGNHLARRLDVPFRDCDAAIEEAANMTIAEIFARDGEAFFRRKETQLLGRLLEGPCCILATGGGAYADAGNRQLIAKRGAVAVWLEVALDLLWERVQRRHTRPLLQTAAPYATLTELDTARRPLYACADLTVAAEPGHSAQQTVERVVAALARHPATLAPAPE